MDDGRRCLTSHIDTSPELCSRALGDTFQFFTHHRRGHRRLSARWNWKSRGRGNGATGYGVGDVAEHQQQHDHEAQDFAQGIKSKAGAPQDCFRKWTHVSHLAPAPNRFEVHLPQYVSNITRLSMHIVNTPGKRNTKPFYYYLYYYYTQNTKPFYYMHRCACTCHRCACACACACTCASACHVHVHVHVM